MVEFIQQRGTLFHIGFSFFFLIILLGLNRLQRSVPSPVNKMFIRWLRLFVTGLFFGLVLKISVLQGVAYWRLCMIGFLLWCLVESLYIWFYILAWDRSEQPLFPKIRKVDRVDWPANKRFFLIRDWIRQNHYEEIGAFRYYYEEIVLQQAIIYQSPDKTVRIQVMIIPDSTGVIMDQVIFVSQNSDGVRYISDNIFMPFGGIYPDDWKVKRYASVRRIESLVKRHVDTLARAGVTCVQMEDEPLAWIEETQKLLEALNIEYGLLNPPRDRQEFGKLTGEGRYRIWKELLLLNYFCKSSIV